MNWTLLTLKLFILRAYICFKIWIRESTGLKNKLLLWKLDTGKRRAEKQTLENWAQHETEKPKLFQTKTHQFLLLLLTVWFLVCILWFHVCLGRVKRVDMNYKERSMLEIKTFSRSQPGISIHSRISILTTLICFIMVGDESTIDQVILGC